MHRTIVITLTLLAVVFIYPSMIPAGDPHRDYLKNKEETEIRLSGHIQKILSAEMNGIQKGMTMLAIAIPAGHWDDIAGTAEKMKESYLMNRKLSHEEREELHHSLPPGFQALDREFHDTAGLLRQAAGAHKRELVTAYFCKLNETCVTCHSLYAAKRFPDFK